MSRRHVITQNRSLFERLESGVGRSPQGCVVESVAGHLAKCSAPVRAVSRRYLITGYLI